MQRFNQFFGRLYFFYLSFFLIFNANGQMISAKMEKDFREDARMHVSSVARLIDQAVEKYEKAGPQAFVDSFGTALTPTDKTFIIKELKGLPPMPHLKMEENNLVFFHKNKIVAKFDSYDVAQGIYQSGNFDLYYDSSLSLIENIEAWKKTSYKEAQTSSYFWMNLILPQAEAKNSNKRMIPLMFAAGIVGILLGVILDKTLFKPKVAKHKNATEPNPASDVAAQTHNASETITQEGKGIQSSTSSKKKPSNVSSAQRPPAPATNERAKVLEEAKKLGIIDAEKLPTPELKAKIKEKKAAALENAGDGNSAVSATDPEKTPTDGSIFGTPVNSNISTDVTTPSAPPLNDTSLKLTFGEAMNADSRLVVGGSDSVTAAPNPPPKPANSQTNTPPAPNPSPGSYQVNPYGIHTGF